MLHHKSELSLSETWPQRYKEYLKACREYLRPSTLNPGEMIPFTPTRRQFSKWLQRRGVVYQHSVEK